LKQTLPAFPSFAWLTRFASVFKYSRIAIEIVWRASPSLTIVMALATLFAGLLPAAIAWVGQLIVDAVVTAIQSEGDSRELAKSDLLRYVLIEAGLVVLMTGAFKINNVCQSILRVLLGNEVNVMILEKALTLELSNFEDSEYYDKLVRARREASSRPLSLVIATFDLSEMASHWSVMDFCYGNFQSGPCCCWDLPVCRHLLLRHASLVKLSAISAAVRLSGVCRFIWKWC